MAPRSLWNGAIAFGLVTVPVKVYTATESKSVHFREVHAKDGSKIEHRRICPKEGKVVDSKEIVRGYQVSSRKWIELEDEEIAAAALPATSRGPRATSCGVSGSRCRARSGTGPSRSGW